MTGSLKERLSTNRGDRTFRAITTASAAFVFVLIGAIVVFLSLEAWPALHRAGGSFFTESSWFPDGDQPVFGMAALVFGTLLSSALALLIALPVAVGSALFVVELAPPKVGRVIAYLTDLLAAVPSVVYGLWGVFFLVPHLTGVQKWLDGWFGFIPLFDNRTGAYGRSVFAAGVLLAIMILPIIAALSREVIQRVPKANREAAFALGATRWEVMKMAVLPYGRSGIIGAAMLGIGRALGETIAVALVLAATFGVNIHLTEPGGNTIAANIATKFAEAEELGRQALIASGLILFAITLAVNMVARLIVDRQKKMMRGAKA